MTPEQDQLLCRYLDGRLSPEDKDVLQELLRSSAVARKRLRLLSTVAEGIAGGEVLPALALLPRKKPLLSSLIPWGIAAAASIVAMAGWVDWAPSGQQAGRQAEQKPAGDPAELILALLVNEAGATFADGKAPDAVRFEKGSYQLEKGAIHLRFTNGADVVIKAPAAFDIDDGFHVRWHRGDMRATVPPTGHGFTIVTDGVDYEDLGTEFAISVDPGKGINTLHVIDGQVDAKQPGTDKVLSSVTQGQSVKYENGVLGKARTPDLSRYPTTKSIGLRKWHQQRASFGKNDADLIGYYPFARSGQLRNEAANPICGHGKIHGARWVYGRWDGKHALLFDRDSDFVELDIPGQYQEMTFSAWVKLDRLEHSQTSVFNSHGWDRGDLHWKIYRSGMMAIGVKGFNVPAGALGTGLKRVPTDQWIHIAASISSNTGGKSGKSHLYLNGELAGTREFSGKGPIRPGLGRIGNWLMGDRKDGAPIRAMRGKMDELAIWKRALSAEEIKELTQKGRPNALWPMVDQ